MKQTDLMMTAAITDGDLAGLAEDQAVASTTNPELPEGYAETYNRAREAERGGYRNRVASGNTLSQVELLLRHMRNIGPISAREAMIEYHVSSLTRRICDIKELGYEVVRFEKTNPVTGNPYTRYGLIDGPR